MGLISRVSSRTYRDVTKKSKMALSQNLLQPTLADQKRKHKKKRLVQAPNSFFMDVKCQGCLKIKTIFSRAQTVVLCPGCGTIMSTPSGGKARLTSGCSYRKKNK